MRDRGGGDSAALLVVIERERKEKEDKEMMAASKNLERTTGILVSVEYNRIPTGLISED